MQSDYFLDVIITAFDIDNELLYKQLYNKVYWFNINGYKSDLFKYIYIIEL